MGSIVIPDPPCGGRPCADALRQLGRAIDHREAIGTVKGMLMIAGNQTADEAFEMLSRESQQRNVKLWQLAEQWLADHHRRIEFGHLAMMGSAGTRRRSTSSGSRA